jgi:putative hydrolase of HD superfamily
LTNEDRLAQQIRFVVEIDKLKSVLRQTWLTDRTRRENDAEHSWHLAIMVILLQEYAQAAEIDVLHVLKMVLIHDLVEIDAGDTFVYDDVAARDKRQREERAADRVFGLLPEDQRGEFRSLWDEFEARRTPEAQFAAALDRLQPILHNYHTQGKAWQQHGIKLSQVIARNQHMEEGAPALWEYARRLIDDAVEKGFLAK